VIAELQRKLEDEKRQNEQLRASLTKSNEQLRAAVTQMAEVKEAAVTHHSHSQAGSAPHPGALAALVPLEQAVPALLEQAMSNELQLMQAELAASKAQVEHLELEWRIANGAARDASAEIAKLKDEIAKLKDKLRVQAGASAASSDEIAKLKDEIAKLRIKGLRNQLSGAQSSGAPPTERQEENPKSKACVLS
jgi:predicted  nucleic acid-binding Zn-ribbon protein